MTKFQSSGITADSEVIVARTGDDEVFGNIGESGIQGDRSSDREFNACSVWMSVGLLNSGAECPGSTVSE